jgi:hypothetical protein
VCPQWFWKGDAGYWDCSDITIGAGGAAAAAAPAEVEKGLGRIVDLYHRSSASYQFY